MNNFEIEQAMKKLRPGASWSAGETYESLKVHDQNEAKPSRDDLAAAIVACATERAAVKTVNERVLQVTAKFTAGEKVAHQSLFDALSTAFAGSDLSLARELVMTYPLLSDSARQNILKAFDIG